MTREALEGLAREAGFDAVGVAPAVCAPHADALADWLDEKMHAGMEWMERNREQRCDPRESLPGARSVIALAMNYFVEDAPSRATAMGATGRIARYARGRDYHPLIRKRLRRMARALEEAGGRQRCFVDSGPLLERDFAVLAGLGWHGKSTLVLNQTLGTWFFLAAIVTTLEIEPDEPVRERCGTCTRCLMACPTGAIVAPHKVDARRCISYWTIEHKGSIPEDLRPLFGDRIFGCDDCLDACPWNRFAQQAREADFSPQPASRWLLREYLSLDEEAFLRTFEGSPIRRARRQGFLRNVCVALGNVGGPQDVPALTQVARDADSVVAEHAQWALDRIAGRNRTAGPLDAGHDPC